MRCLLRKTNQIPLGHLDRDSFERVAHLRRQASESRFRVVVAFVQRSPMQPGGHLETAVLLGNPLQREPHRDNGDVFRIPVILRILMPRRVRPDLVRQLGTAVKDAVDGNLVRTEQIFRQGEQSRVYEDVVHLTTYKVAARAPDVSRFPGRMPDLHQPVMKIEIAMWFVYQALADSAVDRFIHPPLQNGSTQRKQIRWEGIRNRKIAFSVIVGEMVLGEMVQW